MKQFIEGKYVKEEERDLKCFEIFAQHYPKTFSRWKESEQGTFFDILSQNTTGGTVLIETKLRNNDYGNDLFIELEKVVSLSYSYSQDGYLPVYINFIGGYKDIWMWILPNVKDMKYYPCVKIDGDFVPRLGLPKEYGYHFIWNDKTNTYDCFQPAKKPKIEPVAKYSSMDIFDRPINNNNFLKKAYN